jgi:uncharacterized damage-inducible protein DinB
MIMYGRWFRYLIPEEGSSVTKTSAAISDILKLNESLFHNCFRGTDEQIALRRLSEHTNNMAFIACHMVAARHYLAKILGMELPSAFEVLDEVRSIEEVEELPSLKEIRHAWVAVSQRLPKKIAGMTDESLGETVRLEYELPVTERTLLGAILFLLEHEAFHIGQLALLRKHFGLGAMSFSRTEP